MPSNINAQRLSNDLYRERALLEAAGKMQHFVVIDGEEIPFAASRFLYAFIAFDALYSINWNRSLQLNGRKIKYHRGVGELDQQEQFILFCFNDDRPSPFVDAFKEYFLDFVSKSELTSSKDIPQALEDIQIRNRKAKKDFQDDFNALLSGSFDSDTVLNITQFIYENVRCNMFHGAKYYYEMKHEGQQERFNIYTSFLIALCQMGLSFLDYKVSPQGINQKIEAAFKKISPREQPKSEVCLER